MDKTNWFIMGLAMSYGLSIFGVHLMTDSNVSILDTVKSMSGFILFSLGMFLLGYLSRYMEDEEDE